MPRPRVKKRRSMCPLNASVEMVGDRWALLIVRDMMLGGAGAYSDLLRCPERIASNILADRLRKLVKDGIVTTRRDPTDRRRWVYQLTPKGIDLAPVMAELVLWAARYEPMSQQGLIERLRRDKQRFIEEVRSRWSVVAGAGKEANAGDRRPARAAHPR